MSSSECSPPTLTSDEPTTEIVRALLAYDDVEMVHGRNVTGGCFAFSAQTAPIVT